jgi:hypothetical protein
MGIESFGLKRLRKEIDIYGVRKWVEYLEELMK